MSNHLNIARRPKKPPRNPNVCAFCGSEDATTRDHVPPQGIFFEPLPPNLITVDACDRCNNSVSRDDGRFRAMVSLAVGPATPELREWFSGPVLRGIKRDRGMHDELLRNTRSVAVRTAAGLYLGQQTVTEMHIEPYERTLAKITRGLYFHHYGEVLPRDTPVVPCDFKLSPEEMKETLRKLTMARVGDGKQFQYAYGRASDDPRASVWFYLFHERHLVSAYTGRRPHRDKDE